MIAINHYDLLDLANPDALHSPIQIADHCPQHLRDQLIKMIRIRRSEEVIASGSQQRQMATPVHLAIGQEAVAVGVAEELRPTDRLFGAHRSHAHYIAVGGDLYELFAEILGRNDGCSKGMGGSMHLCAPDHGLLGTVPIVAGTIAIAAGAALAAKKDGRGDIAVAFFGDGAAEEGALHEALNLAAVWKLPMVFVCENNLYSSHLHISQRQPASRVSRYADAHQIPSRCIDGNDVIEVQAAASEMIMRARHGIGPSFLEAVTYRWRGHVGYREDDDVGIERGASLAQWKKRDPIGRLAQALIQGGHLEANELSNLKEEVSREVDYAWSLASHAAYPEPSSLLGRVFAEVRQ
jgi:TPP-dependent pyruvate/acetoin dehydrogenase alpha subunit